MTTTKAYLSITKMANSGTMCIEKRTDKTKETIYLSFEDFTRLITGQVLIVEVEKTERDETTK